MTTRTHTCITGKLATLALPGKINLNLDGFWVTGNRKSRNLLIFVHGMGSNFYKSKFKKAWMKLGPKNHLDIFCFNNRGCEGGVNDERFKDCLADIDAALTFARAEGYRHIILLGHSTGCQKITYYYYRKKPQDVNALILTAIGDDLAIAKRDLGRNYLHWLKRAHMLVTAGKGGTRLPPDCLNFSARRFISAVDPHEVEAGLFHFEGNMRIFHHLKLPVLAVLPEQEQYACIPVKKMAEILKSKSTSPDFLCTLIPDADHSFHGREEACVNTCIRWLKKTGLLTVK